MLFIHCLLDWKIGVFQQTVVSIYYIIKVIRYILSFVFSGSMKVFLNWLCQHLSFLGTCPVEKCGFTPFCLYHDPLTLTLKNAEITILHFELYILHEYLLVTMAM